MVSSSCSQEVLLQAFILDYLQTFNFNSSVKHTSIDFPGHKNHVTNCLYTKNKSIANNRISSFTTFKTVYKALFIQLTSNLSINFLLTRHRRRTCSIPFICTGYTITPCFLTHLILNRPDIELSN